MHSGELSLLTLSLLHTVLRCLAYVCFTLSYGLFTANALGLFGGRWTARDIGDVIPSYEDH